MSSPWTSPDPSAPYQGWTPQPESGAPTPQQGYGAQPGYGAQQGYTAPQAPQGYGAQQGYTAPQAPQGYGAQQGYTAPQAPQGYGAQPSYGAQPGYNAQPGASGYSTTNRWGWQSKPGIIPLRPLTMGDLFSGAFEAIRSNPKVLSGFTVVIMLLVSLIASVSILLSGLGYESVANTDYDPQALQQSLEDRSNVLLLQMISNLVQWIVTFAGTSILTGLLASTVSQMTVGRNLTLSEAWAMTRKRLGSLLGSFALTAVITMIPVVLWIVAVFASLAALMGGNDDLWWLVLVAFAAIIPVFILIYFFQIKLLFAPICAVLEEIGPVASLKRSWSLVKGEFWPTLGRFLLLNLVVGFIGGFIGFVIGLIGGLVSFAATSDPSSPIGSAIAMFFVMLGSSLLLPFSASFETLMYTDLRIRKENFAAVLAQASAQQQ